MKLKELREKRGLSQSQLAAASGVKYRTIQEYELGRLNLNGAKLKSLLCLCKALECRLYDLVDDQELIDMIKDYERA